MGKVRYIEDEKMSRNVELIIGALNESFVDYGLSFEQVVVATNINGLYYGLTSIIASNGRLYFSPEDMYNISMGNFTQEDFENFMDLIEYELIEYNKELEDFDPEPKRLLN